MHFYISVSSVTRLCLTLCNPMDCSMTGFLVHHQFLELAQTHVHWVGDTIQPSHHLSSPSPPAFNLSQDQGVLQWVSSLHPKAKVLQLHHQYSVLPMISFRIDWLDLLAVQRTLKSFLQNHFSEASILWCSAFLMVQFSHPYMTTEKP